MMPSPELLGSFAMALHRSNLRDHTRAIELVNNLFLLPVPHFRLKLHDRILAGHRNPKILWLDLHLRQETLHFRRNIFRMTRRDTETHDPRLQIRPSCHPAKANKPKQHHSRGKTGHTIEAATGSHTYCRFDKDRGRRRP